MDIDLFLLQLWALNDTELASARQQLTTDDGSAILVFLEQGRVRYEENNDNVPTYRFTNISSQRTEGTM